MFKRYDSDIGSYVDADTVKRYNSKDGQFVDCSFAKRWDAELQEWIDVLSEIVTIALSDYLDEQELSAKNVSRNTAMVEVYVKGVKKVEKTFILDWPSSGNTLTIPYRYSNGRTNVNVGVSYTYYEYDRDSTSYIPHNINTSMDVNFEYNALLNVYVHLSGDDNMISVSCNTDYDYSVYSEPDIELNHTDDYVGNISIDSEEAETTIADMVDPYSLGLGNIDVKITLKN